VLEHVLDAHRAGALASAVGQRARLYRGLARRFVGTFSVHDGPIDMPIATLLRWGVAQIRPDAAPLAAAIPEHIWLHHTQWRPFIAVACFYGFLEVPKFKQRTIAMPTDSVADRIVALWDIAPSSFYRYVERGRLSVSRHFGHWPPRGAAFAALLQEHYHASAGVHEPQAWHTQQAQRAEKSGQHALALWHVAQGEDSAAMFRHVARHALEFAGESNAHDFIEQHIVRRGGDPQQAFGHLALATLARVRGVLADQRRRHVLALNAALPSNDSVLLGVVYGEIGRAFESGEIERALSSFRQSLAHFERAQEHAHEALAAPWAQEAYALVLVRLGWLYVTRNDPRARVHLAKAAALLPETDVADEARAVLYQAQGELFRREGNNTDALDAMHKALDSYERLGNTLQCLRLSCNLSIVYGFARKIERARYYAQRVFDAARTAHVDLETLASTHLHLGGAYFWDEDYQAAIDHYLLAQTVAEQGELSVVRGWALYNLAEAHFQRFQLTGDAQDELAGDAYVERAAAIWQSLDDQGNLKATRTLKQSIIDTARTPRVDQLLSGEKAVHFQAITVIEGARAQILAGELSNEQAIEAQLNIAQAYAEIAATEREILASLVQRCEAGPRYASQLHALQTTFERSQSAADECAARWHRKIAHIQEISVTQKLVHHLLTQGPITKSTMSALCGVSPATASKRLTTFVALGLLLRQGRGPQTRYSLHMR
jgi:tetratricopeptide (TPR) repeat protein